jgi:hypothetical protein
MFDMSREEWQKVDAYTDQLQDWMVQAIVAALADVKPAKLSYGNGTARFAVNRRPPIGKGPVDHDVPVLKVETADGRLQAVVFGYACHNTTLDFYQWCGDYAGFAQEYLERSHPGTQAMFWSGCGADANPLPRRSVELCQKYGKGLAQAVDGVLTEPMSPVSGSIEARYTRVSLPLDVLPTKDKLSRDLLDKNGAIRRRAARLLKTIEEGGKIDDHYRTYPIQVIRFGDQVLWIALGGEVVVDYAIRLKKELGGSYPVWVTGYANDVMAYIPSLRVLKEGGYEGDTSMTYYGLPTKWAPTVEEMIIGKVHEMVGHPNSEPEIVFADPLKGKLGPGWHWLRENKPNWRHADKGLEIRVEPGLAPTVKNALVRSAPDRSQGKYAIEVTIEFLSSPSKQYEQAGITWYQGQKPIFKLVHEFIDAHTYIIPGKKPTNTRLMQLRLVVDKDQYIAQFRPDAQGEYQTAASGKLQPGSDEKISIQCYNGPPDAEHWIRFSDFRILKIAD